MLFNVVTLFPQLFDEYLSDGVVGRARLKHKFQCDFYNPRAFATDVHQSVDDRPYGGGDGMLMMPVTLEKTLNAIPVRGKVVYLSPHGKTWNDKMARSWARSREQVTLICGRYAGIDERFIHQYVDEEISIGDFVLSGGELAAQVLIDSIVRHIDGVLGHPQSAIRESFFEGQLESPQFTRPEVFNGEPVPRVLLSGHHVKIEKFRKALGFLTTLKKRPDLLVEINKEESLVVQLKDSLGVVKQLDSNELRSCGFNLDQIKVWTQWLNAVNEEQTLGLSIVPAAFKDSYIDRA